MQSKGHCCGIELLVKGQGVRRVWWKRQAGCDVVVRWGDVADGAGDNVYCLQALSKGYCLRLLGRMRAAQP